MLACSSILDNKTKEGMVLEAIALNDLQMLVGGSQDILCVPAGNSVRLMIPIKQFSAKRSLSMSEVKMRLRRQAPAPRTSQSHKA